MRQGLNVQVHRHSAENNVGTEHCIAFSISPNQMMTSAGSDIGNGQPKKKMKLAPQPSPLNANEVILFHYISGADKVNSSESSFLLQIRFLDMHMAVKSD